MVSIFRFAKDRASKQMRNDDHPAGRSGQRASHTTRIRRPRAFGGKLRRNFARTPPLLPWARVTLPQMIRTRFRRFWPGTKVLLNERTEEQVWQSGSSREFSLWFSRTFSPCTHMHSVFLSRNLFHVGCWYHQVWVKRCSHVGYVYHVGNRWKRLWHRDWREIESIHATKAVRILPAFLNVGTLSLFDFLWRRHCLIGSQIWKARFNQWRRSVGIDAKSYATTDFPFIRCPSETK